MAILIADSGSTKTDWCLLQTGKKPRRYVTQGMNPFFHTEEACANILSRELKINRKQVSIERVIFYGAGVKDLAKKALLQKILKRHFSIKAAEVYSDMLGAARATAADQKGIVCILGTGSNSCYYNGKKIMKQNPSLGYIIGDEGSGVYLGKRVLQYYFYKTFDDELQDAFRIKFGNDLNAILRNIYAAPHANRYLASFTLFLMEHKDHYMVQNIVEDAFIDFYQRHILKYRESWQYPVHFAGTVAYEFSSVIHSLHQQYGLSTGSIIKNPVEALCRYHQRDL